MKPLLSSSRQAGRQGGASLFIALLALVAMSFAGLALIRSVDTTNVISGNLAFRQAALHVTDVGVETAFNTLSTIVATSQDASYPAGCATGACNYYATQQTTDSRGIPTVINWNLVPATTVNSAYTVQYVIDRLCAGPTPVTDIAGNCYATAITGGGTKKSGGITFSSTQQVFYRATIRAVGPRNTVSIVQTLFQR